MEIYLLDGYLKVGSFIVELPSDVDVGGPGAHGPTRHQAALHQLVRVMPHDLSVLKQVSFYFFLTFLKGVGVLKTFLYILCIPIRQALTFLAQSCEIGEIKYCKMTHVFPSM
jgi:hypothetical protein